MEEWKSKCDCCKKDGDSMFARVFYKKINNEWQYLCAACWIEN